MIKINDNENRLLNQIGLKRLVQLTKNSISNIESPGDESCVTSVNGVLPDTNGNVQIAITQDVTFTVEPDDLQELIDSLPHTINASVKINVNAGTTTKELVIYKFTGSGNLTISGTVDTNSQPLTIINNQITIFNSSMSLVRIMELKVNTITDRTLNLNMNTGNIILWHIYSDTSATYGLYVENSNMVTMYGCQLSNKGYGILAQWNCKLALYGCVIDFSSTYDVSVSYGSVIFSDHDFTKVSQQNGGVFIPRLAEVTNAVNKAGDTMTGPLVINEPAHSGGQFTTMTGSGDIVHFGAGARAIMEIANGNDFTNRRRLTLGNSNADTLENAIQMQNNINNVNSSYKIWGSHNLPVDSGLWTPRIRGDSVGTGGNYTSNGTFFRIGSICFIVGALQVTTLPTGMTGNAVIDPLPFPVSFSGDYPQVTFSAIPAALPISDVFGWIEGSAIKLASRAGSATYTGIPVSSLGAPGYYIFSGWYFV